MNGQNPCMALKAPKVQRGISLSVELNEAIRALADTLGKTWNEVAESALSRAFLKEGDLHNRAVSASNSRDEMEFAP